MPPVDTLEVYLRPDARRELKIGIIVRDRSQRITSFFPDDAYLAMGPVRPLVSLSWTGQSEEATMQRLTRRADKLGTNGYLPPFFDNLLPEGALRELVEKELGHGRTDHFDVLARLGMDLPGALTVHRATKGGFVDDESPATDSPWPRGPSLRFSLAGVQLKFSMKARNDRLTLPMLGEEVGDVILKVPHKKYRDLPEMEHAAMTMVAATGRRVALTRLVPSSAVEGLPEEYLEHGSTCLAVTRFDRGPNGLRVQMEDFAQITGALGDQKYTRANEETVLNIVRRFATDSRGELVEAIGRSVCNMLIGNGDAHLKNWSFLYPEGGEIALSPTYDVVPTVVFGDAELALPFMRTSNPDSLTLRRFERAADLLEVPSGVVIHEVKRTVESAFATWPAILREMMPSGAAEAIVNRINRLPFVKELLPDMDFSVAPTEDATVGAGS